jgi:integrase/recombinase XerC
LQNQDLAEKGNYSIDYVKTFPVQYSTKSIWEDFLEMQIKGTTRRVYSYAIRDFCQKIYGQPISNEIITGFLSLNGFEALHCAATYQKILIDEKLSGNTVNVRTAAVKALVNHARRHGYCTFNLSDLKLVKARKYRDTKGIPPAAFKQLLSQVDRSKFCGVRDYAILLLMWNNALRRGEVVSSDLVNFIANESRLWIMGKGEIDLEHVDLTRTTVEAINAWLLVRPATTSPSLFTSLKGNRLDGTDIYRSLRKYGQVAAIDRVLSPHRIRHAAITACLDATDGNVRMAQSLSRHDNLGTLMVYDDNRREYQKGASEILDSLLD